MFLSVSVTLQVQLLYELLLSWSSTWARLQRHGILRQTSSIPEPPAGAAPSSPVRSSAGTALPDTSTCSPSADFGSPTEVCFSLPVTYFILSVQGFLWIVRVMNLHIWVSFSSRAQASSRNQTETCHCHQCIMGRDLIYSCRKKKITISFIRLCTLSYCCYCSLYHITQLIIIHTEFFVIKCVFLASLLSCCATWLIRGLMATPCQHPNMSFYFKPKVLWVMQ